MGVRPPPHFRRKKKPKKSSSSAKYCDMEIYHLIPFYSDFRNHAPFIKSWTRLCTVLKVFQLKDTFVESNKIYKDWRVVNNGVHPSLICLIS